MSELTSRIAEGLRRVSPRTALWSGLLLIGVAVLGFFHGVLADGAIMALYGALFVPYAAVVWRSGDETPWWFVAGVAVIGRLLLVPQAPVLSDDLYRYVWDGRVALSGINPFVHAPASEALASLRDGAVWPNINHPEVPTIYPPGAQYLFVVNAAVGGGLAGMKLMFVGVEVLCVAAAGWLLVGDGAGESPISTDRALAIYALNPLVVVEVAWSGHLDVVAWGLLAVGLVLWLRRETLLWRMAAAGLVGASVAVKFLGLIALPVLLVEPAGRDGGFPWSHRLAAVAIVPLIAVASYAPYLGAGSQLFDGFSTYAERWRSNDGGFRVVHGGARSALRAWAPEEAERTSEGEVLYRFSSWNDAFRRMGWTRTWKGREIPDTTFTSHDLALKLGKFVAVLVVGLVLLLLLVARVDPVTGTLALLVALYLFAPVVHPWYVGWLVPFAALRPGARRGALVFSAAVVISYLAWRSARHGGPWRVTDWAVAVEYGAVLVAVFVDLVRGAGSRDAREE